jgi:MFS family permease
MSQVVFTVAHLIITDAFQPDTHALAGAVFNTVAQLGSSIGLSIMAVISHYVTKTSNFPDKNSPEALMLGYRAAFWAAFVMMVLSCIAAGVGLTGLGTLGDNSKEEGYSGSSEDEDPS